MSLITLTERPTGLSVATTTHRTPRVSGWDSIGYAATAGPREFWYTGSWRRPAITSANRSS